MSKEKILREVLKEKGCNGYFTEGSIVWHTVLEAMDKHGKTQSSIGYQKGLKAKGVDVLKKNKIT